jgi:hypothetical protein
MLFPFALLLPIGDRLPRGFVWPAFIALPAALGMIYYFVREPRGRGFNRILVRTVFTQFLFGILLSLGLVL